MRSLRRPLAALVATALAGGTAIALSAPAAAANHFPLAYGLTSSDRLVTFLVEQPGATPLSDRPISGLMTGDDVVGIDVRPATGQLYALVKGVLSDRLFLVDPATGAATQVGPVFSPRLNGTSFGVDFNPEVDRIRIVSDADQNLRVHPDTGVVVFNDAPLAYKSTDAGAGMNPNVTAVGYENNVPGGNPALTPKTELYGIDTARDVLVEQDPPNAGTLNTIGPLNVGDVTAISGLDIAGSDNGTSRAYAVLVVGGVDALYTVNTDTGSAVKVGDFNPTAAVEDLALADPRFVIDATASGTEGGVITVTVRRVGDLRFAGTVDYRTVDGAALAGADYTATSGTLSFGAGESTKTFTVQTTEDSDVEGVERLSVQLSVPTGQNSSLGRSTGQVSITDNEEGQSYGLTTGNQIVTFSVNTPGTVSSPISVTGLQSGEDLVGIDVRPATSELYAVGNSNRVYKINPANGAAVAVGAPFTPALSGTAFGMDFNPVVDRIRLVSNTGQNLRLHPDTGAVVAVDGPLSYASTDAGTGTPPRVAAAAYKNNVKGATTTELYDIETARDVLVTQAPPNDGTLVTDGPLGVAVSDTATVGLDISSFGDGAFAVFTVDGTTAPNLYRVNLDTGAATSLGALGNVTIEDLSLVAIRTQAPTMSPSPSATATATMTATATATATTTATATSSTKPCTNTSRVTVNTPFINATGLASVTISGVAPGARAILEGYSQVHEGTANFANAGRVVRTGIADANGTITFNDIRPSSNTRVRALQEGCTFSNTNPSQSLGAVINVRTTLFIEVTRVAPRTYRFAGDSIPARTGGLIVSIFRITGATCAAGVEPRNCPGEKFIGQARANAITGEYSVTLPKFGPDYPAREQFVLKTGQDAQNAPGRSNVRDLAVF